MKYNFLAILFIILITAFGCSTVEEIPNPNQSGVTRTLFQLTETDDNRISEVDVLAFKVDDNDNTKEHFAYRVHSDNIQDDGAPNKKQFTVNLQKGGNSKYRFVVLANSRKIIDGLGDINASALKNDLLARLISHHEGAWETNTSSPNYADIPMWAETSQMYINEDAQTIGGLFLLRMLARVDVMIDTPAQSKFKLKSIRLYNYNTYGQIVPLTDASHWNGNIILEPTIPFSPGRALGPIVYEQMSTPDISLIKGIYLYETERAEGGMSSKETCLVLGGEYNNEGKDSYYRVDFFNSVASTGFGILRNHLYNIKISNVTDSGSETPEEAFNSQSVNIDSDITIWSQGAMSDVVVDGPYRSTISQDVFNFPMNQRTAFNTDNKLTIFTEHPSGWSIEKIVDEEDSFIGAQWLTLSRYAGAMNETVILSVLADENVTEVDRTAFIHFKLGRIIYVVKVNQSTVPEIGLTITDESGKEINTLQFYSHVGGTVPAQRFNVNWTPLLANLSVTTSTLPDKMSFVFGSGDEIVPDNIVDPSGMLSYNIQPPAMTQAEVDEDPFRELLLRVDFTVNSGVSYESKSLFLQQKNLAAIPTTDGLYFMDGTEKYFTIRSNAPWKIEVTNDPNNVVQKLITTSGGFNQNKEEEKVYFRIIDDMTNFSIINSTVTFSIKSLSSEYPLPDTQVTLYCVSAYSRKTLLTIGSDPNGFGYNFSGTAASNKLITTASNFGTTSGSAVKSQGFTIINGGINPSQAQMLDWLITNPVDMVVIGYDYANISTTIAGYYAQYLQNGGVVLAYQDRIDALVSANFLKAILGNDANVSYGTGAGSVYSLVNIDNEVLVGPFGDIRGLQWGHDASTTVRVNNVSSDLVDMLSGTRDISTTGSTETPGYMTSFKHKTYNLVWVGDGGFNSNNAFNDLTICPFKLDGNNFPVPKASYGRGTIRYPVYNSVFTANAIAWGVKQAELKRAKSFRSKRQK